jgi:hypothetical protein
MDINVYVATTPHAAEWRSPVQSRHVQRCHQPITVLQAPLVDAESEQHVWR